MRSLDLVIIERANPGHLEAIEQLLGKNRLPLDGLRDHLGMALIARRGVEILGCAAVENYGQAGLLRSVAVHRDWRNRGLGRQLVYDCLDMARVQGIARIYLLTETAVEFFRQLGFTAVQRDRVDHQVTQSLEFVSACPQNAQAMFLDLSSR
jgi:amino-acid N-acetyltransferase